MYLQQHYTSPEEPAPDSKFRAVKKFVTRCISHFTKSQNEFNANVVRTLDSIHHRADALEQQELELNELLSRMTAALQDQLEQNKQAEEQHRVQLNKQDDELKQQLSSSIKTLREMQSHHGAVIAQTQQKVDSFPQAIRDLQNTVGSINAKLHTVDQRQQEIVERIGDVLEEINGKIGDASARQDDLVEQLENFNSENTKLIKRQDKLVKQLEDFSKEIFSVTKRQDDLVSQLNDTNVRQSDIAGTIKAFAARDEDITKRQDDLVETVNTVNEQVPSLIKDTGIIADRIQRSEQGFTELQNQLQTIIKRTLLLRETLDDAVAHIPPAGAGKKEKSAFVSAMLECRETMKDVSYEIFEDANRGSAEEIRERLGFYLPRLENCKTTASSYILDIGCGRGEFLELLADAGLHAKGIDINRAAVSEAKSKGLSVKHADLFAELERIKPNTLAGLSAFHVIEHLPFDQIYRFLELAFTRLKPDGILMLETPNALNLRVAASEFYRDPTHIKPVHPSTLEHALRQAGFDSVEIEFLHPFPGEDALTVKSKSFSKPESHNFKALNELILGCRDCAVTATKKDSV
jgi:O-antigen chain-terminating methyltransferase